MNNYMYILEGETEQKIINTLKGAGLIISGKIKVLNVLIKNIASMSFNISWKMDCLLFWSKFSISNHIFNGAIAPHE